MAELVRVWDLPTRLFHGVLVVLCVTLMVSGQAGWLRVHMTLGPAVLVLIGFRLTWGLVGSDTSRFSYFVKGPAQVLSYLRTVRAGGEWQGVGHNPVGALSVLVLLTLPVVMVATGLFSSDEILTDGPLAPLVSTSTVKLATRLHDRAGDLVMIMVALHLAAILFYRFVKREDLNRPMIVGSRQSSFALSTPLSFASSRLALGIVLVWAAIVWGSLRFLSTALQ